VNTTVVAKEGQIEPDGKGGQYLVLKNGRRYQGTPGQAGLPVDGIRALPACGWRPRRR
jgi:hypothetical protein